MKPYTQLTQEQRYQIFVLLKIGHSQTEIAALIGFHKSSISREIRRNRGIMIYHPVLAQRLACDRHTRPKGRISLEEWDRIGGLIKQDLSPEQVSRRLKVNSELRISHEWIYQYIWKDKRKGGGLYRHLRRQKRYRKRSGSYVNRGQIPNRVSIEERPGIVNARERLGDWEVDTIIGKRHKHALVTLTERKSRLALVRKVEHKSAEEVTNAILEMLKPWRERALTITSDNGKEFAQHQRIATELDVQFFFAHPYSAWERGANENMNGLLRQYFPKKRSFDTITDGEVQLAVERLNNRPRKCLAFQTPLEVFLKNPCCT